MKKINYDKLTEITVKSQEELDNIPLDFKGRIYIEFGTYWDKAVVKNKYYRSVVARGNSSVEARENTQVVDRQIDGKIKVVGNARIVYMPKNINDFIDFYGIEHTKTKAIFYKAVRKGEDGTYQSDYNSEFTYEIGKFKEEQCDDNVEADCSYGIHISHRDWAINFGRNWTNLAILEVETKISDIVLPKYTDGKVRTSKIKVLREVPLEECGLYGKIIAKRRKNDGKD